MLLPALTTCPRFWGKAQLRRLLAWLALVEKYVGSSRAGRVASYEVPWSRSHVASMAYIQTSGSCSGCSFEFGELCSSPRDRRRTFRFIFLSVPAMLLMVMEYFVARAAADSGKYNPISNAGRVATHAALHTPKLPPQQKLDIWLYAIIGTPNRLYRWRW